MSTVTFVANLALATDLVTASHLSTGERKKNVRSVRDNLFADA
jgi:hypothetical protein